MMKKLSIVAVLVALAVIMAGSAQAAFTVGGENGWSLSTDGIVNVFAAYQTTSPTNPNATTLSLLGFQNVDNKSALTNQPLASSGGWEQKFGVRVGLLPSIIAFNVKAPTVNGIESNVRVAFYPNIQNSGQNAFNSIINGKLQTLGNNASTNRRFDTSPNIDNREFFYTATGKYGQLLAGRALNLFQGQNILNDMTLFTAGVVDMTAVRGGTSLGHIAYGYLYTNFGPQIRYTTPDFGGVKFALEVAEPYAITINSGKQPLPRLEAELSYATTFKGGSVHAWLEGLWQQDTRDQSLAAWQRPGGTNTSLGIAPGINVQIGPVGIMGSGYYGRGLGMVSAQDGDMVLGETSSDAFGKERKHWGFLAQATYNITDAWRLAVNYGQTREDLTDNEVSLDSALPIAAGFDYRIGAGGIKKCQEALVGQVNYMLNKFTQFTFEYIWAQDTWMDNFKQRSNQVALGTVFFW